MALLNGFAVFVNRIAGKIDFIIPEDTGAALIKLNLLEETGNIAEKIVTGEMKILFYIVEDAAAIVERDGEDEIGEGLKMRDAYNYEDASDLSGAAS